MTREREEMREIQERWKIERHSQQREREIGGEESNRWRDKE